MDSWPVKGSTIHPGPRHVLVRLGSLPCLVGTLAARECVTCGSPGEFALALVNLPWFLAMRCDAMRCALRTCVHVHVHVHVHVCDGDAPT